MHIKISHQVFIRHNDLLPKRDSIWFFHGFGDSGLAYREVFQSVLAPEYNLYVVDCPGFGASPPQKAFSTLPAQAQLMEDIIREELGSSSRIILVAHSIGALIATQLAQELGDRVLLYCNIEGNLTEADSYFSSKPQQYEQPQDFARDFEEEVFQKAQTEERYRRYYASLRLADPGTMRAWSFSSLPFVQKNACGYAFKALSCPKLYIWGDVDTPQMTQTFLKEQHIAHRQYPGIGHWHMLENADSFYPDLLSILQYGITF